MVLFMQFLIGGISVGSIYALLALGFVLIYKACRVFNFAQGEFLMLGAYVVYALLVQLNLPLPIAILIGIALALGFGFLLERVTLRPLIGQPVLSTIMMTLALAIFLQGFTQALWGSTWRSYPKIFPTSVIRYGEFVISMQFIYCFVLSMIFVAILVLFFKYTKQGLGMRAVAEDHSTSQASGINVSLIFALSWGISATVSVIGGFLLGSIMGLNPPILASMGLKVFPIVLLGGLESLTGAIVGGFFMGVVENMAIGYIDPLVGGGMADVFVYFMMLVVLIFKPYGLFGLVRIERI